MKTHIPGPKLFKLASQLRKIKDSNVVRFRGYSLRPSAIPFEYCSLSFNGEVVHNLYQLISNLNAADHFIFQERLRFILQALSQLNYLHNQNIIHKDFKPANLLVTGSSVETAIIKVTDSDELLLLKQTINATFTESFMKGMTISYTAPELCLCLVKELTMKSDMYSFAISSYEILTEYAAAWFSCFLILNDTVFN